MNVLVTRQEKQSGEMMEMLKGIGCEPFLLPLIETVSVKADIPDLEFDVVVFTSTNAVDSFVPYFRSTKYKWVVAVGIKTKEVLENLDIPCDGMPSEFSSEGLKRYFDEIDVKGKRFLLPGPRKRMGNFIEYLEERGAEVHNVVTYETLHKIYPDGFVDNCLKDNDIDIITLTSPSCAQSLLKQTEDLGGYRVVCVGKTTGEYLENRGVKAYWPDRYTVRDMVELIAEMNKGD
ncbi:uroporphyrinogen-III synthase [Limisalsivibrio acetivorans]|uniref:uroporphyrinogen-III synthase n=1 Tax=Limisalsivibrio acetivorans TaxID=1304888 RepID=UPI0003B5736F|nr:uroporphyrinogen-III synthase [Limisalsivibrio acetivorans]